MSRVAGVLFLLTAVTAALLLFYIKQQVRDLERELEIVHRGILQHQEAIQVLRTEWSYLNQPARIAELSSRHLGLGPVSAAQILRLEDLSPSGRGNGPIKIRSAQ
jgi:cell division protein FtsL